MNIYYRAPHPLVPFDEGRLLWRNSTTTYKCNFARCWRRVRSVGESRCRRGTAQLLSWLSSTSASSARESKFWPAWCSSEPSAPTPPERLATHATHSRLATHAHPTHQHQRLCHRRLRTGRNHRRRHRRSLPHGSMRSSGPAPRCWQRSSCRQPCGSGGNGGGVPRPRARCNVRRARTSGDRAPMSRRARFVRRRRRV